jgi:homoserine dehydrogenase
MNVALLGFGVVGSGVAELLNQNKISIEKKANENIDLIKILEIRDMRGSPFFDRATKDPDSIFNDDSIEIVVETIGGVNIAYKFTMEAFARGKHVVTSNKELVAKKGPELLKMATKHGVNYLFEASVGGGIPIIRPLEQCLAANEISMVTGILNGTTNYILTRMREDKLDFATALKQAQKHGYAESDPDADIDGIDTRRKIAILSSIAYGKFVDSDEIPVMGIRDIDIDDIEYARALNAKIKLLGASRLINGEVYAAVEPFMINIGDYLSNVDDVFNAILVKGDAIGEALFYGRGAGKLPTASAVIADIIYITRNRKSPGRYDWSEKLKVVTKDGDRRYFIRAAGTDHEKGENATGGNVILGVRENEYGLVTGMISTERLEEIKKELDIIKVIKYT